ncbi:hypothetical protein MHLP_01245 [Candidatus Mycoplasma haematolamae str. Purdue]|uniref:Uncharacterized protein n=1 Tax=Mycoplasma haematolamae (strain Purdue) TaxID=1212765 RepID=I7CIY1_MYCHA|nr:hypothetical protein [Candidatus Mycoplasma haematolamae]AFO51829.1 hypothetical protein MHLP_01245 [Candidatus Mycoplasma haematolamae str. Purdue]
MPFSPHRVVGGALSVLTVGGVGGFAYSAFNENQGLDASQHLPLDPVNSAFQGDSDQEPKLELPGTSIGTESSEYHPDAAPLEEDLGESVSPPKGEEKTYTFFFKGNKNNKESVTCSQNRKPEMDSLGNGHLYISCRQEGDDKVVHSGSILGGSARITCTLTGSSLFECSHNQGNKYKLEKKGDDGALYLVSE